MRFHRVLEKYSAPTTPRIDARGSRREIDLEESEIVPPIKTDIFDKGRIFEIVGKNKKIFIFQYDVNVASIESIGVERCHDRS